MSHMYFLQTVTKHLVAPYEMLKTILHDFFFKFKFA